MKTYLAAFSVAILLLLGSCKAPVPTISKSYENALKEEPQVEVPEVYEAMQIALSLTDTYQSDPNLINKSTPYYQEMVSHFGRHKTHPLVLKLDRKLKKAGAYGQVNTLTSLQSLNYELEDGKLLKKSRYRIPFVYNLAPYPLFLLHSNRRLFNSFVQETGFEEFYSQHRSYYASLIAMSHELCDYAGMKQWLEREFPKVQNQALLVVFSPLTGGSHSQRDYLSKDGQKKQMVMFVSAPNFEEGVWKDLPDQEKSAYATRTVFTEIDHSYVNPTTDLYLEQIEAAMQELGNWKTEKVIGGYNSFPLTFNEYMTWGVYTLYAYDTYPADVFNRVIERQVEMMASKRGFIRFREFNEELLRLYKHRKEGERVADLYPQIIEWMKATMHTAQNSVPQ